MFFRKMFVLYRVIDLFCSFWFCEKSFNQFVDISYAEQIQYFDQNLNREIEAFITKKDNRDLFLCIDIPF